MINVIQLNFEDWFNDCSARGSTLMQSNWLVANQTWLRIYSIWSRSGRDLQLDTDSVSKVAEELQRISPNAKTHRTWLARSARRKLIRILFLVSTLKGLMTNWSAETSVNTHDDRLAKRAFRRDANSVGKLWIRLSPKFLFRARSPNFVIQLYLAVRNTHFSILFLVLLFTKFLLYERSLMFIRKCVFLLSPLLLVTCRSHGRLRCAKFFRFNKNKDLMCSLIPRSFWRRRAFECSTTTAVDRLQSGADLKRLCRSSVGWTRLWSFEFLINIAGQGLIMGIG